MVLNHFQKEWSWWSHLSLPLWSQAEGYPALQLWQTFSKSTLLPSPQGLCTCYYPCWERLSSSSHLSHLLLNLQDSLQDSPLFSGLPQHPLYYRPDSSREPDHTSSWYWPLRMAVFCLHVFLLQQTVGAICEATHVSLTLTLPPTSEYRHMDGSYILKGIQLSEYASKHFSMDHVELHI